VALFLAPFEKLKREIFEQKIHMKGAQIHGPLTLEHEKERGREYASQHLLPQARPTTRKRQVGVIPQERGTQQQQVRSRKRKEQRAFSTNEERSGSTRRYEAVF
jgi:hypothetical protein